MAGIIVFAVVAADISKLPGGEDAVASHRRSYGSTC